MGSPAAMGAQPGLVGIDLTEQMGDLLATDLNDLLREFEEEPSSASTQTAQDVTETINEQPEGIHEIPAGQTFTLELNTGEKSEDLLIAAREVCKEIGAYGRVLRVQGVKNGIRIIVSSPSATFEQRFAGKKSALETRSVFTEIRKNQKPLAVGVIEGVNVVEDAREKRQITTNYSPTTATDIQEEDPTAEEKKRFSEGERDPSILAITQVRFKNPQNLEKIRAAVEKFGAVVIGASLQGATLILIGEKTLAGAAELAAEITAQISDAQALVTAAYPMQIAYIEGQPVLLDSNDRRQAKGFDIMTKLGRHLIRNPAARIVIDEISSRKTADERIRTEAEITTAETTTRGIREITKVERGTLQLAPSKIIGRDVELTRLDDFMERTYDNEWNFHDTVPVMAITGGAGHGKTRMGTEITQTEKGLYVTATPVHTFDSGWFLQRVLETVLAEVKKGNDIAEGDAMEEEFFSGKETQEIQQFVTGDWKGLDKEALAKNVCKVLKRIADGRDNGKMVVFLDNLEACDEFSAQIISQILKEQWGENQNLRFILGGRTATGEEIPASLTPFFRDSIEAAPLKLQESKKPTAECIAFVKEQLGASEEDVVEEDLLLLVAEHSQGVPLFVIGTCRTLKESGSIRRTPTGTWTKTASIEEIRSVLGPTGEGVIETRLEHIIGRGTVEMARTFSALLAVGSMNQTLVQELITQGVIDLALIERLRAVGMVNVERDGSYAFSHPLYLEKGRNFVPHSVQRETAATLAILFDGWIEENIRTQTDIAQKGLNENQMRTVIFGLAQEGGETELMKKYGLTAAYTLRDAYANERCIDVVQAASRAMSGDKKHNGDRIELELVGALARTRLGRDNEKDHERARRTLRALWNACKSTAVGKTDGRMPTVAARVIEALCYNAYMHGGPVGRQNLEEGLTEWENTKSLFAANQEEKIALYGAYLDFKKGNIQMATEVCNTLKNGAKDTDIRWEAQRMFGMAEYNGVFFGPIGDQEITEEAIAGDVTMRQAFRQSGDELEEYVQAESKGTFAVDDRTRIPNTIGRIAFVKKVTGDLDDARKWAERGCRAAKKSSLPLMEVKADGMLGEVCMAQGETDNAIRAFTNAYTNALSVRAAEAEWPVAAYNLARALQKKGGRENKERAIALGVEAIHGFAMEYFKEYRDPTRQDGLLPKTKETINALFTGGTPSPETINNAIEAAMDASALSLEFPPEEMAFYPLPLLSDLSTTGKEVPAFVKSLCVGGIQRLEARKIAINKSEVTLPNETKILATRKLEEKSRNLSRLSSL